MAHPLDDQPVKFSTLQSRLNRFKIRDILTRCNAVANFADDKPLGEASLRLRLPSRYRPVVGLTIVPWALAFIAKTAINRASDNRQANLTDQEFAEIYSMQSELEEAFLRPDDLDIRGFMFRAAWEQFPLQEAKNRPIPRMLSILLDANQALGRSPVDVEAEWLHLTGISLERFIEIGFLFYAGASKYASVQRHFPATGPFAGIITPEECEAFLKFTSATYEEFRDMSARPEYRIDDPLYAKTEFNVLHQRPLIVVGDNLVAPVPRILLQRVTDGLRFDLRDAMREERGNRFSSYFGFLFEHYVGSLLKWAFGDVNVKPEPVYGVREKRGPDWIVLDHANATALLFECRTSSLMLESKSTGEAERILGDLKRILIDTATKYPQKIRDLQSGAMGIDTSGIERYIPIVITYEPAYLEPTLREIASQALTNEAQEYLHVDTSDLETLTQWNEQHAMTDVLEAWRVDYKSAPQALGTFLNKWADEHNLDFRNDFLDTRMQKFVEDRFGQSYPPQLGADPSGP